jgi:hypothetical protein
VACHGEDPTAFLKTRFVDQGRTVTAEVVIKQLRTPAQFMPMFNPTQVSDEQATQVSQYFASLTAPASTGALPTTGGPAAASVLPLVLALGGLTLAGAGLAVRRRVRVE